MARPPNTTVLDDRSNILDAELLQRDSALIDAHRRDLQVINEQWGENLPYDRIRIEHEARFYLQQSADSMLEAGKRLILLKEHEPHGDFTDSLGRIGLTTRAAQKMMQAAVKFSGAKAPLTAHLGKTKLLELMTENDDDLESLAEGGTLAGMTLDAIDKMTARELRQALRTAKTKAHEDAEVTERLLADKNQKIDDLARQMSRRENASAEERLTELDRQLTDETRGVLTALVGLTRAVAEIYGADSTPEHLRAACYQSIERIRSRLRDIELDYDVTGIITDGEDDLDPATGMPVWATNISQ